MGKYGKAIRSNLSWSSINEGVSQQTMFDYRSSSHHSDDAAQVDELQVAAGAKRSELMGNSELPGDQENSDWSLPI